MEGFMEGVSMIGGINVTVSNNTYMLWQTVLAMLLIITTGISFYRAKTGARKEAMSEFQVEVMDALKDLRNDVGQVKNDVWETTVRLESHIEHFSAKEVKKPRATRKKQSATEE